MVPKQLWPTGTQWLWEDHLAEMHRWNPQDLPGSHHGPGETPIIPWPRGPREDGWLHAPGESGPAASNMAIVLTYTELHCNQMDAE